MPVAVGVNEVVQVLHQYNLEGQECENVWYFQAKASDPDVLAHLLADIAVCLLALVPYLSSSYTLERLKAKVVSPAVGPEEVWTPAALAVIEGAAAGDSEPSFVSAVISLHTGRGGRSGRGRIYIGGIPEGDTVRSILNPETPLWTALLAFCACMLDKFRERDVYAEGNYTWGVMSRKIGGTKPPFLVGGYAHITKAEPKRELGTTRNRKLGHGR
jgi:hypothetical protein